MFVSKMLHMYQHKKSCVVCVFVAVLMCIPNCTCVTQPASYQQLHIPPNQFHAAHSTKPQQQECVSKCLQLHWLVHCGMCHSPKSLQVISSSQGCIVPPRSNLEAPRPFSGMRHAKDLLPTFLYNALAVIREMTAKNIFWKRQPRS